MSLRMVPGGTSKVVAAFVTFLVLPIAHPLTASAALPAVPAGQYQDLGYPWAGAATLYTTSDDYDAGYPIAQCQVDKGDLDPDADHLPHPISSIPCNNKGAKLETIAAAASVIKDDATLDPWGYYLRNCTSFVAFELFEHGVQPQYLEGLGDGGSWAANAPLAMVHTTPQVGAAAVAPGHDHVAYVLGWNANSGSVTIAEYNHDQGSAQAGEGDVLTGTPASFGFTKYVYFKSLMAQTVQPGQLIGATYSPPQASAPTVPKTPVYENLPTDANGSTWTLDCPATNTCYLAVPHFPYGAVILSTHDGGAHWSEYNLIKGFDAQDAPSVFGAPGPVCPSALTCYVAVATPTERYVYVTLDGGANWSAKALWSTTMAWPELICPSESTCYAGDNSWEVSRDFGNLWVDTPALNGPMACAGATCYASAAGSVDITSDDGQTWAPVHSAVLQGVAQSALYGDLWFSCPNPWDCYADNGNNALAWSNGASTWKTTTLPAPSQLVDTPDDRFGPIICPSAASCYFTYGSGQVGYRNSSGGWSLASLPSTLLGNNIHQDELDGCSTANACLGLAGDNYFWTPDSGSHWSASRDRGPAVWSNGASCTPTACYIPAQLPTLGDVRHNVLIAIAWSPN